MFRRLLAAALLAGLAGCASTGSSGPAASAETAEPSQMRERQSGQRRHFDPQARRYYTIDPADGCTYWTSGEYRGCEGK